MSAPLRLVLTLHNHQPVGNFDHVFEAAYQESYRPFLDVFAGYPELKIALHTSGPLMEWLDAHHPEYIDRLAELVTAGRIEIIGGAFYEPILTMLPSRDRVGQIRSYTSWLENRLGAQIRGLWMPERVWEQSLVADLAAAGIEYTALDDFHFKNAGLTEEQLHGYLLTEDHGALVKVFPGNERLRYTIPFAEPHETIEHLSHIFKHHPAAVVTFADDGEKLGTWPGTHEHVYTNGWLTRFFNALLENSEWIQTATPSEVLDSVPPLDTIYLPDSSYREMTEWALPVGRQLEFDRLAHHFEHDPNWHALRGFMRGGFWRNFKVKYPEANEMYARMMQVSGLLETARSELDEATLADAQRELYRGQCNCSYWHGAFGGIYLPHLRNAVYNHLIAAHNLLDRACGRKGAWVEASASDYNLDARQELCLANDTLIGLVAPSRGGQLYELDVRSICHNLLATLARRPEAYHAKVMAGPSADGSSVASIHDRVVFKQEGLNERLHYDAQPRKSLLDRFYDADVTLEDVAVGSYQQHGDFISGVYDARLRRSPTRIQAVLRRSGNVGDTTCTIVKTVTLEAGSGVIEIGYQLEGLPLDSRHHFGVEFNMAGMPGGADDRYFQDLAGGRLGHLGTRLDAHDLMGLSLTDEWLGMAVQLEISRPTGVWTHPVETVSQSEGGFELVHQSVAVIPHWHITPDQDGRWSVAMRLAVDTSMAEQRMETSSAVAAG